MQWTLEISLSSEKLCISHPLSRYCWGKHICWKISRSVYHCALYQQSLFNYPSKILEARKSIVDVILHFLKLYYQTIFHFGGIALLNKRLSLCYIISFTCSFEICYWVAKAVSDVTRGVTETKAWGAWPFINVCCWPWQVRITLSCYLQAKSAAW